MSGSRARSRSPRKDMKDLKQICMAQCAKEAREKKQKEREAQWEKEQKEASERDPQDEEAWWESPKSKHVPMEMVLKVVEFADSLDEHASTTARIFARLDGEKEQRSGG